ncbi:lysophospholipid acyltransferase family protein [Zobellia galactanivorans]|uniref:Lipid A biosynthesis lauroyl acyltransferase n=1 Tax=Zobellia galactanivorans (strain DSM 12802 / CCUG 47099 / CIP 106680 / NCIMB 13871 / Dsij) TaxID=63186 RepID=G0L6N7_ZOBGA|nr:MULTISPECIES: lysophospholipid acyltransferase family protein [Zobellia]MDO6808915.1 lysophospholipid acyltransferase family protein [Zobellia galactanivorans]OWW25889.1 lipid A biosynthesis acyltransferase [Zobellia sp. OII3]CAZ98546.1 Lipid A biosynthesis lauroyl acyltransferase [Zobellia galactanivorans]
MQLLVFILAYPLLWLISILPYRLFYGFSDFVFFLVYHVVGYRKDVVKTNLELAFPNKTEEEILTIRKKFYHHMCDAFLEMVKTMNLSKAEVAKRYAIQNIEVIQEIEKEKTILVVCSHYANWEWNVSINNHVTSQGYAVYQKISNPYFDRWVKKVRARWNTILITKEETAKVVLKNHLNNKIGIFGMVSDQSPQRSRAQYWTEFMGVKVPVINGAESFARKMDLAVVFLKVSKVKRGYYSAEFIPITTSGKSTEKNEITDTFLRLAEQQIREKPEYYLWTHRRWKHRNNVPAEVQ